MIDLSADDLPCPHTPGRDAVQYIGGSRINGTPVGAAAGTPQIFVKAGVMNGSNWPA
jgi:hypothetical protein